MSDLEFTSLRRNDELQGSDNRLPASDAAAPGTNRSSAFSRPSLTRVKSCFNDVRQCRCSTRVVVFAGLIILGICYFAQVGVTTTQAKDAAKAPESLANNLLASDAGWTVVNIQGSEATNIALCPVAVSWNPYIYAATPNTQFTYHGALKNTQPIVLELQWSSFATTETNGGTGILDATLILPGYLKNRLASLIDSIPAITVKCTFQNIGSVSVTPQSTSLSATNNIPVIFPKGSFRFFPMDEYEMPDLEITCFATTTNPRSSVLQVNSTSGQHYSYPVLQWPIDPSTGPMTTTGTPCKATEASDYLNDLYDEYSCLPNKLPVFLSYVIRLGKGQASSSLGSFAHDDTITQPLVEPEGDCAGIATTAKYKARMYRPADQRYLPVIFTIGMIIVFIANLATTLPALYGSKVEAHQLSTTLSGMFVNSSLWAYVQAGASTSTIIYNSSYYWIQLLNMLLFFFLSYKFMRQLLKDLARTRLSPTTAFFKKSGGGAGEAREAAAYDDDEDAEKNV